MIDQFEELFNFFSSIIFLRMFQTYFFISGGGHKDGNPGKEKALLVCGQKTITKWICY